MLDDLVRCVISATADDPSFLPLESHFYVAVSVMDSRQMGRQFGDSHNSDGVLTNVLKLDELQGTGAKAMDTSI